MRSVVYRLNFEEIFRALNLRPWGLKVAFINKFMLEVLVVKPDRNDAIPFFAVVLACFFGNDVAGKTEELSVFV